MIFKFLQPLQIHYTPEGLGAEEGPAEEAEEEAAAAGGSGTGGSGTGVSGSAASSVPEHGKTKENQVSFI